MSIFRKLVAKWRAKQRAIDLELLWPMVCWEAHRRGVSLADARIAFSCHAANDPAWQALSLEDYETAIADLPGRGPFRDATPEPGDGG